jgi:endonuclease/exonuclease/phosphatase family metal-dependent hydrolase
MVESSMLQNHHSADRAVFHHPCGRLIALFAIGVTFLIFISCNHRSSPDVPGAVNVSDTIAVGFYNVENLFDLYFDGNEYPEYRPGALGWNKQTWEKKVKNIASVIAAMNVDIIGLAEVENRNALQGLQDELKKCGADFPYSAIADLPNRTVTCPALLSRVPIAASQGFGGGNEMAGRRNILEADVDCGGATLKLFVNHWPSKAHPESGRLAMAQSLVKRIAQLPAPTAYVIIGDLNSNYDEWRAFHTEGHDDTRGETGLNHLLKTIHGGPGNFSSYTVEQEMAATDSVRHYDLWLELPENRRMSLTYHGSPETPDHILLPPALFRANGISYCDKSFDVFTWNGALLRNGEPFGWQMSGFGKRRFHLGEGYSDHLPIRARFTRKPFTFAAQTVSDTAPAAKPASGKTIAGGFEKSMEGWVACTPSIIVCRDSSEPASGRYCLRIKGDAPEKNCCAARTVMRVEPINRPRWSEIAFDIRGSGKILVRIRSGKGRWRYYTGPAFGTSGSARYLPVTIASWRHIVLPFTYDRLASSDLAVEVNAGKNMPFCFYLDNVAIK